MHVWQGLGQVRLINSIALSSSAQSWSTPLIAMRLQGCLHTFAALPSVGLG
jgi:hypothetical protein